MFERDDLVHRDKNASETSMKAMDTSQKLLKRKAGLHEVVQTQPEAVTLMKDGILDAVSTGRETIAQRKNEPFPPPSIANNFDEADKINPPRAAADTTYITGKETRLAMEP